MSAEWLTPTDVSNDYQIPERTLSQWRYLGKGPRYAKVGRHIRYRASDVEGWLQTCTVETGPTGTAA
jgi:hypothetical protein